MSICPSKDIHSIYLDNELPASYVKQYEEHVKNCPACTALQNKLKAIKEIYQADNKSICFSKDELDKSYERLLTKMSYSKTKDTSKKIFDFNDFKSSAKYIFTGVAAAAVVALILPIRMNKSSANQNIASNQNFEPVPRTSVSNFSGFSQGNAIISASTINLGNSQENKDMRLPQNFPGEFSEQNFEMSQGPRGNHSEMRRPKFPPHENFANSSSNQNICEGTVLSAYDLFLPMPEDKRNFQFMQKQNSEGRFTANEY